MSTSLVTIYEKPFFSSNLGKWVSHAESYQTDVGYVAHGCLFIVLAPEILTTKQIFCWSLGVKVGIAAGLFGVGFEPLCFIGAWRFD